MKNYKYFKDDISAIINGNNEENHNYVYHSDGKLVTCKITNEHLADLAKSHKAFCSIEFLKWLNSERAEELNQQEYGFCLLANDGYLVRNKFGNLYYFDEKPVRDSSGHWKNNDDSWNYNEITPGFIPGSNNLKFEFITWEDENPRKIKDLIKLPIRLEDETDCKIAEITPVQEVTPLEGKTISYSKPFSEINWIGLLNK